MAYITGENRVVSSRELEERIGFSQQCIFNAARKLKKVGLISTISGPFGGYRLGKRPEEITIQEILSLFKDSVSICTEELLKKQGVKSTLKNFAKRLSKLDAVIGQEMYTFTLADLIE